MRFTILIFLIAVAGLHLSFADTTTTITTSKTDSTDSIRVKLKKHIDSLWVQNADTIKIKLKDTSDINSISFRFSDGFIQKININFKDGSEKVSHRLFPCHTTSDLELVFDSLFYYSKNARLKNLKLFLDVQYPECGSQGGFSIKDSVININAQDSVFRIPVDRNMGIDAASIRIFSDLLTTLSTNKQGSFQVDSRIDFRISSGIIPCKDNNCILFQRVSPFFYLPKLENLVKVYDTTTFKSNYDFFAAANTRAGLDLAIIAWIFPDSKIRFNCAFGFATTQVEVAGSNSFITSSFVKPYLRIVLYEDRRIDLDIRGEEGIIWGVRQSPDYFENANLTIRLKNVNAGPVSGTFFSRFGAERNQSTLYPFLEIGYLYDGLASDIFSKYSQKPKKN